MCEHCDLVLHTEAVKERDDGRYILRQEVRLLNRISKQVFAKQLAYVLAASKKFWPYTEGARLTEKTQKELLDKINSLANNIPEQAALNKLLQTQMELLLVRGSKRIIKKLGLAKLGVKFDLKNKGAVKFLKAKSTWELSNRNGNIHGTTKKAIKNILINAADNGTPYTQLAKEIQAQGTAGVFSRSRATTIATRELGQAYEAGNNIPVADFLEENPDREVEKFWQTVGDENVTETHKTNEGKGWVKFDYVWQATGGDKHAPGSDNPRCRCFTKYKILAPKKK